MGIFDFLKRKSTSTASDPSLKTSITSINIRLGGDVHSLPGRDVGDVFDVAIPFRNRLGNGLLPDNLTGPNITVSGIAVDKPFELLEIKPQLPVEVPYMSNRGFSLKIRAPQGSYNGPLLIKFDTSSKDNIDLNVSRIMLVSEAKRVELEGSTFNMNIKRGQIFRRDIQLYKVLSFGQKVSAVEVAKPFEIISTEPKVPFTLDKKDSYIVTLFIKCPEFSYAGEVEISFR